MKKVMLLGALAAQFFWGVQAMGAIQTETVVYRDGKTTLEGFLAYDDSQKGPRPVVLIVHQWMGLSDHEKMSARKLAESGYVALAVDIYGKGVRPVSVEEAGRLAGEYKNNTKLFRAREKAAIDFIKKNKMVDSQKIVIMGYCFGGTGALEAARAGLPVVGAVSFHGGLATTTPQDARNVRGKILVLHGAIDPYVPAKEVEAFMSEMNNANVDYQFVAYSGAVHSFTQYSAGSDPSKGFAYHDKAAQRSWLAFMNFLDEVAPLPKPQN